MKLNDLTDKCFGKLTVVRRCGEDRSNKVLWECDCECGTRKPQRGNDLVRGKVSSCGCEQYGVGEHANAYKHGMSNSKIRQRWSGILGRCGNPKHPDYPRYGGRGIRVCDAWKQFKNFLADMGVPAQGITLEREDNDGDYCKENCKWATRQEQSENRRNTKFVEINGENVTLSACSRLVDIPYRTLLARHQRGDTSGDAIMRPIVRREKRTEGLNRPSSSACYRRWVSFRSRCRNPREPQYKNYGGRGITVHPRWEKYETFFADMGEPSPGLSLDRIDPNLGYGPGNCRWADQTQQIRNRRTTRKLTVEGVTRSFAEWSEIGGVGLETIVGRIKRGWPPQRAVYEPTR